MDRSRTSTADSEVGSSTSAPLSQEFKVGKVLRKTSFSNRKSMNACSQSRRCKRAVFNPKHATLSVAMMGEAARLFRFSTVRCARKVRTFAAKQRSTLFCFGFFGRNFAKPRLPNLFSRFQTANVSAASGMFGGVFYSGKALDRKSTRLNSSHIPLSRMPSSA